MLHSFFPPHSSTRPPKRKIGLPRPDKSKPYRCTRCKKRRKKKLIR